MDWEYKLYCVFSAEAVKASNGVRGKMHAQSGHAYTDALLDSMVNYPDDFEGYVNAPGRPKICLVAPSPTELFELEAIYKEICGVALIKDAAHTVFAEPTYTCLGIGPIHRDKITSHLEDLKPFR